MNLKKKIKENKLKNKKELINIVKQKWNNIESEKIKKAIKSMPSRVKEVIRKNRNPTKY